MKIVKFLKPWRAYNTDEVAGFDDLVAEELVKGRVAEAYKEDKAKEPKKESS